MVFGLGHALSVCASVRGKRGKPGPRSPTCRELTYPAPRGSLVLPASSGKRLAKRLARPAHRAKPIHHRGLQPDKALAPLVSLVLVADAAERELIAMRTWGPPGADRAPGLGLGRSSTARSDWRVVAARKKVAEAHGESPSTFAERTLSRSMARSKIVAKPLKTRAAADKPIKRGRRDFQTGRCGLHIAAVEIERGGGFLDIEGNSRWPRQPRKIRKGEEFIGRWSAHGGSTIARRRSIGDGSVERPLQTTRRRGRTAVSRSERL